MAGLQRSAVSFRRQGSSGLVWDDKFLSGELTHQRRPKHKFYSGELPRTSRLRESDAGNVIEPDEIRITPIRTSRSAEDGRRIAPPDPPSPKLSACGCCGGIARSPRSSRKPRSPRSSRKPRSR